MDLPSTERDGKVRRRHRGAGLLCLALVTGCTGTAPSVGAPASGTTTSPGTPGSAAASPSPSGTTAPPATGGDRPGVFGQIPAVVREVEPSVVTVFAGSGVGSGVVYREDGTLVTNEHVVGDARTVRIGFADGQRVEGQVVAADPATDLAVVRVGRTGLPVARFQTELPQVGELALALGSPLGFEGTVSAGIISGLNREIPGSAEQSTALVNLIQTDAPISPGNSGGALVDADGDVVGINEAYLPPSTGAVALGFAIPSATVVDVVEQLLRSGSVRSPFVGIRPGRITEQVAGQLGLQRTEGVLVLDVVDGSPAEDAGLAPGDVVTGLDGTAVRTVEDFLGALRRLRPGQTVPLVRLRDGREETVQVTLSETTRSGRG